MHEKKSLTFDTQLMIRPTNDKVNMMNKKEKNDYLLFLLKF